jgi:hypothetical protein
VQQLFFLIFLKYFYGHVWKNHIFVQNMPKNMFVKLALIPKFILSTQWQTKQRLKYVN